jgi:hypothetical protein
MKSLTAIALILFAIGCASTDAESFRRATRSATKGATSSGVPVSGLPVDSVRDLRTQERVIVYYTDTTLKSMEGPLFAVTTGLPSCDSACRDTVSNAIRAKLTQQSPLRFWRNTTIEQVRTLKQDELQIIVDTRDGKRYVPLWRVEAIYSYTRNDVASAYAPPWWLFLLGAVVLLSLLALGISYDLDMRFPDNSPRL